MAIRHAAPFLMKTQTAVGDTSPRTLAADSPGSQKIRLFYAGDMDFARPQFASEAPQLELLAVNETTIRDARAKDSTPPVDVAFIDCSSPGVNAPWLLEEIRRAFPTLPVVVAVDPGRDDAAREAVDLRADDYTVKSPRWLARLPVRLGIVIKRQRRLNEADALRSHEQRLRSIIESAPACLTRLNREGTVLAINVAGRALLGVSAGRDVLQKSILPFVDAAHHAVVQEFLQRVCGGQAGSAEFSTAGDSDSSRFIEANAIPLPPHGDRAETALLVLRDVTTRRRLELSLEHVETIAPPADNAGAVAELEGRLADIELQCREHTAERDRLAQAIEEGNATLDALQRRLEERALELNSVVSERDGLARRVETTDAAIGTLEAQLHEERLELDRLKAERDRLAHSADHGNASAGELAQRLEQRDSAFGSVTAEREDLSRRLETANAALNTLEGQLGTLEGQLNKERLERTRITTERDHLLQKIREDIQPAVAALKQELEKRRLDGIRLTSERDALQGTLDEIRAKNGSELEAALAARLVAETRLREAEERAGQHQTAQQQHEELAAQIDEWKGTCQALEGERTALEAALLREADERANQARVAQQKHDELAAQLHESKGTYEALEAERHALEAALLRESDERANQARVAQQKHDELAAQLHESKGTYEALEAERHALEAALLRESDERANQARVAQQKHDELAAQLHESRGTYEALEAERHALEAALLRETEERASQARAAQQQHDELAAQLHRMERHLPDARGRANRAANRANRAAGRAIT